MTDENRRFVDDFANPHSWVMTAEDLHEQASLLYRMRDRSSIRSLVNANNILISQTRVVDKSIFLLCGFALENAIKAFLVYEHPQWISNGNLSGRLKSHSLTALQAQSSLIPYKKRYLWVLSTFEDGLESWARYPCALTVADTKDSQNLYDTSWDGYTRVMHAYGKRLTQLFDKEWRGPHGTRGQWDMRGDTFGYKRPLKKRPYRRSA
jgi:hypothetical protein